MADERDEGRNSGDLFAPLPDESYEPRSPAPDSQPHSERPSLSLGPLGMLGFGPRPDEERVEGLKPKRTNSLVIMASLVIIIAAIKIARPVLVPLTVAIFLATLTAPVVIYLKEKKSSPRGRRTSRTRDDAGPARRHRWSRWRLDQCFHSSSANLSGALSRVVLSDLRAV